MEQNNTKVLLSFSDNNVSITLFNNVDNCNNILFDCDYELKEGIIKNGFIINSLELFNIVNKLIIQASLFTELKINSAYISIDCSEITIKPLELEERKLDDGVFDKILWDKLRESVTIKQISQKYIYDLEFVSWIIDGKEYTSLDNQIAGDKLVIKANAFQINKVLYNQYLNLMNKLNIQVNLLKPIINNFAYLPVSINKDNHELFIYINNSGLTIIHTTGRRIIRSVFNEELGLNKLYQIIATNTGLEEKYIKNILNTTATYGNNIKQMEIINGYSSQDSSIIKVHGTTINNLLAQYAKGIVECVDINRKFLSEKKNVNVKKTTYVPSSPLVKMIMHLTQMYNTNNTVIYEDEYINDNGEHKCQIRLLMEAINSDIKNNKQICTNPLTNKEIKFLREQIK